MIENLKPEPSVPQRNSPNRLKKLEQYARSIVEQAVSKEKSGDIKLAVQYYLKAADILLVLAKNSRSYNDWNTYSEYAASYHRKINSLLQQIRVSKHL